MSRSSSPAAAAALGGETPFAADANDANLVEIQSAQQMLWTMDKFRPPNTTKVVPSEPVDDAAPAMSGSASMRRRSMRSLRRLETSSDAAPQTPVDAPLVVEVNEESAPSDGAESKKEKDSSSEAMDASERSVMFREESFRPYNTWADDRATLLAYEMEAEEPIELLPQADQEVVKNRRFFQTENNAQAQHYDVLGFNASQNSRRVQQAVVVAHADDDTIAYCTGNHITTVDMIDKGRRKMLPRHEQCIDINTFAVSSSGKYIAVAERRLEGPCVAVSRIDSGTRVALLSTSAIAKSLVVALAISSNNKYLATVTASPEHKLVLWQLEDQRVMAVEDLAARAVEVVSVAFCPWDSTIISTVGPHHLLSWEYENRSLIMADLLSAHHQARNAAAHSKLVDHTWYDEHCVCALTEDGTLIAVEKNQVLYCSDVQLPTFGTKEGDDGSLRRTMSARSMDAMSSLSVLDRSLGRTMKVRTKVQKSGYVFRHVVWASRGVIVTASGGTLALLDRTYDSRIFSPVCIFHVTNRKAEIMSVSVSPAEENLVVALSCNTMECVQLCSLDDAIANKDVWQSSLPISRESQALLQQKVGAGVIRTAVEDEDERWGFVMRDSVFVEVPHASFHDDTITSLSVALQSPLVLTTSADGTARLYNFVTHEVVAFKRLASDEILSAAIHPMGLHCIFTTEFSTQVFGVIGGRFFLLGDLDVRGAVDVKYSNQGGRIAFCVGNRVLIYDGHSYSQLGQLVGHTVMIKSISWSDNDRRLLTTDVAGTVCGWDTTTYHRDGLDLSQKNLVMQCAKYHPGSGLVVGIGVNKQSQRKVFEGEFTILCAPASNPQAIVYLRPGMVLPKTLAARKLHTSLLAFAELSQTLFVGSPAGRIFLYSWPLIRSSRPYDFIDLDSTEVLHITISNDERFLFAVTAANVMFILRLDQQKEGRFVNVVAFNHDLFTCLRYAQKSDDDAYSRDVEAVRHLLQERRRVAAEELAALKDRLREESEALAAEKRHTVERMKADLEKARATRVALEKRTINEGLQVESQYSIAAESLEVQYNKLQEEANQRYLQLLREKDDITVKYETLMAQRVMAGEREVRRIEERRIATVQRLSSEIQAVDAQIKDRARRGDAMLAQTVVDHETDLKELKAAHQRQVLRSEENLQKAGAMASIGDREVDRLEKECAAALAVLEAKRQKMKDITSALERKGREAAELKVQMVAKQEAINVAEKKLQALKHQLAVLENIKFVLLHQLDAEAAEIEPKNERIEELAEELANIETEMNVAEGQRQLAAKDVAQVDAELNQAIANHAKIKYDRFLADRKLNHVLAILTKTCESFRDPLQMSVQLRRTLNQLQRELAMPQPSRAVSPSRAATSSPPNRESPAPAAPAVEELEPELQRELTMISENLQRKKVALSIVPVRRQQQLASIGAETVGENQLLVDEIKDLRSTKKEVQSKIGILETQLRETRNALARLVESNRRQLLAERRTLMLTDVPQHRTPSPVAASASAPSPALSQAPPTVVKVRGLPPLGSAPGASAPRALTPASLDDLDITWGSVKKAPPGVPKKLSELPPRKAKKKAPASLEAKRAELQGVIVQLEENTIRMRSQQQTIALLRGTVQRLLALEEQRLTTTLNASRDVESALERDAQVRDADTTIPMVADGPDWTAEEGRPMTPVKAVS
jgi:WD40 repeat protein